MTAIGNRRSTPVLYSDALCIQSHRVRLALSEKRIAYEAIELAAGQRNETLLAINPYGSLPTLADKDIVLYDARVIIDYLDERYPHPPFMPVDPVSRGRTRLALMRMETDWYALRPDAPGQTLSSKEARSRLAESLTEAAPVFEASTYLFGEEYSILDATLAPLLWRLPAYGIVLPETAAPVTQYARRMFAREGFQASLSAAEREMAK